MLSLHRNLLRLRNTTAFLPRDHIQLYCENYEMLPGNLYWNRRHHEPAGEVRFAHGELAHCTSSEERGVQHEPLHESTPVRHE